MKLARDGAQQRGGRRRAASRVARKPLDGRAPGANHLNVNRTAEHQADQAADLAVRGERNAARVITETPTARYDEPS
jgi:hypothetical protein